MFKKKISPFVCIMIALMCCAVTFVAVYSRMTVVRDRELNELRARSGNTAASSAEIAKQFTGENAGYYEKLAAIMARVEKSFLFEYDKEAMWDAICAAALDSLGDRFTYYMTKDEYEKYNAPSGGDVGIGVRRADDAVTGGIYVVDVMENSPAERAGLKRGDVIVSAGGVRADGSNVDELVANIVGEKGTVAHISLLREGEELEFDIVRDAIPDDCVYSTRLSDDIWLVCITGFTGSHAADDIKNEIANIRSQGCEKIIFDLRGNHGGRLDQIVDTLDFLLPEGDIVSYKDMSGKEHVEKSDALHLELPMVVVCDETTVSAAELFTAALKDYKAATIVGKTTYGKGIMQNIITLPDGSGFSFTTSYYNPPSGVNYHGTGVVPDIETEFSGESGAQRFRDPLGADSQIAKAFEILNN